MAAINATPAIADKKMRDDFINLLLHSKFYEFVLPPNITLEDKVSTQFHTQIHAGLNLWLKFTPRGSVLT